MMLDDLIFIAQRFGEVTGKSPSAISIAIFGQNDRNRIRNLIGGMDVTTRNYERCMDWFSANWPADAEWPAHINRPQIDEVA